MIEAKTHRDQRVDRLETGLHWLVDGSSGQDTWGLELGLGSVGGLDGSLSVNGVTESVDDSTQKSWSDWDIDNLTGSLDGVTFLDETIVTEDGNTDVVGFQVEAHSSDTRRELNHLLGLDVSETVDTGDTISNGCCQSRSRCGCKGFGCEELYSLKTRPVSWTSPPAEAPAIRPSRIEETSEAAVDGKRMD